jgi:hypothetical protein
MGGDIFARKWAAENFLALNIGECQQLLKTPSLQWLTAKEGNSVEPPPVISGGRNKGGCRAVSRTSCLLLPP